MLTLVVVPLDGSAFGEQALPTALRIAEREHAELELVHVFERIPPYRVQGAPPIDPTLDADLRKESASYLDSVAGWLRGKASVPVTATLLDGPVAETLDAHIAERHADLVVMTTHGRGGLSRLWLGSVAAEVVRGSRAPVLLIRPEESGSRDTPSSPFGRVLVPLDMSPESEEAVDHAMAIAGDPGVRYLLLHVIREVLYIMDPIAVAYPDEAELREAAERYLGTVAERMRGRGYAVETRVLRHAQPARAILQVADEFGAELVALETHGHGPRAALLVGSVADKVVRGAHAPVLVHRPTERAETSAHGETVERQAD